MNKYFKKLSNLQIQMKNDFKIQKFDLIHGQGHFINVYDESFSNIKFQVVKTIENFNLSTIIISIFHIYDNNLACLTSKNGNLILVFIDISL
jgi:hypothetical protein